MTERDFIYWLNGYLELSDAKTLTAEQVKCVKDHLKLVLKKETPAYRLTHNPTNDKIC